MAPGRPPRCGGAIAGIGVLYGEHRSLEAPDFFASGLLIAVGVTISWLNEQLHRVAERAEAEAAASRQQEDALRASEERYRLVANSMHDVVTLLEPDGRVLFISPSVTDRLGWPVEDVIGRNAFDYVHPDDRQRLEHRMHLAAELQDSAAIAWRCHCHDGSWRWLETNTTVLPEDVSGRQRVLWTSRDITDRRNLEDQLRQAQKMEAIGRLAGGVAHDFNNVLTVILGYATSLEYAVDPDDPLRVAGGRNPHRRRARRPAHAAAPRIQPSAGAPAARARPERRGPPVEHDAAAPDRDAHRAAERISMRRCGRCWSIPGRWSRFHEPGRQRPRRDAERRGDHHHDQARGHTEAALGAGRTDPARRVGHLRGRPTRGTGMPPAVVARIFEPFFTTKPLGRGTGLGLSMVYGIIKQSAGFIFCESVPAQGTTLRVYLPRADAPAERLPGTRAASGNGAGTVLVVEDEPAVRALVGSVLRQRGYTLIEAGTAREAMGMLRDYRGPLHLLVTDVIMPEMTGVELARRVVASGR